MAYADGKTLSFRKQHQPFELAGNFFVLGGVVQKNVPSQMRDAMARRHPLGYGFRGRAAIKEVEVAPVFERLHEPVHGFELLGQQAAHVVADARYVRHRCQIGMQSLDHLFS